MNDKNRAIKVTDEDIQKGVEEGRYIDSGKLIRDTSNGQIVKILKENEKGTNHIPSTLIQVHHSFVYQADLSPIIEAIARDRECHIYDSLEEKYNLILDCLDTYHTYGSDLEMLHKNCIEAAVLFDNKIRREIASLPIGYIENKDLSRFSDSLDAYIKILFVYIICTYLLHREKFSNDKVIISKLMSLEKNVRELYEQLLASSSLKQDRNGNITTSFYMENSLYSMYLFHDDYDVTELEKLVSHDSRFSSSLQLIGFFKEHFKHGGFRRSRRQGYSDSEVKISVSAEEITSDSNKNRLAKKLFYILEDIGKLKGVREEIVGLNEVDDEQVLITLGIKV